MKYAREVKVGVLSIVCLFLLFFGFHFLKGVNIFSPVHSFHGYFQSVPGLTEQAPVYIRGYKVGQVDHITYDFTRDSAFLVDISIDKSIVLPAGTEMALVSDGLLGGNAISLEIPMGADLSGAYANNAFLPTVVVPGLIESLQDGLLAQLSTTIAHVDEVVEQISSQLDNNHLENVLSNADELVANLKVTSRDLKGVMHDQVPGVVEHVDSVVTDLGALASSLRQADIAGKVDTVVAGVNGLLNDVRSTEGTVGKLLYDKSLYNSLNATVVSADSLFTDIKAHPRHYLYPLGAKEKKKK